MHERAFPGAAGVSPPWWVIQWAIAKIEHCSPTRERTSKSGGRQPAVGMSNAVATVSVHRPPTGRLCATIAVLPLQARFSNHGWLTPAAPGCPRADCCRKAVAICNGVLYPTGGLRPPLLLCSCERLSAKKRFVRCTNAHSQERRASARRGGCPYNGQERRTERQPAVGMSNAVAIADAFVQRPAQLAAGRKPRLQRQRVGFPRFEFAYREDPTGGLRPPLLRCSANVCRRKNDLCDARTRIPKSGGRQPAVAGDTMGYRKNRALFADSRTYQQERRVSARRGYE
jgi:hypothetical protein